MEPQNKHTLKELQLNVVNVSDSIESKFKTNIIFKAMADGLEEKGEEVVKKMKATFCFKVTGGPDGKTGVWFVDLKSGKGSVSFGEPDKKPDVTFTLNDSDCFNLMTGKLNPQLAFMQKKLKIQGNIGIAMKLRDLQKSLDIAALASKL